MTDEREGLRFGVTLATDRHPGQSPAEVLARTVEVARRAEELGLDDVWVTEHHFLDTAVNPSALTLAAYLLAKTETLRVGTAVTVLPLHSPVHTAEQAALLDQLSGGRFSLGVGRGFPGVEYDVLGPGLAAWRAGLAGPLDRLLGALRGEVSADPALSAVRLTPPVHTSSGPPVYVAAGSPASIELAADRGLPLMLFFDKSAEAKAEMVALYERRRLSGGHPKPAAGHAFAVFTQVCDAPENARRLMRDRARFILSLNNHPSRLLGDAVPAPPPVSAANIEHLADTLLSTHPVGSAETCVERLAHHIRTSGCTRVMCQVEAAADTGDVLHNLERLATEVFPAVRHRVGAARARITV
ncbi:MULTISPECIES: LLM class flavin-dependent oxidoreductase [Streptomyces]|uniref:LLM class flavin-dependent oxidoreductase n=1 Tax=Streptomyces TaxID=1883 RepID=UPI001E31255F|nr:MULTISPECIES: LLM class flavin-dependent oxidoreductase [Streptomyces]UFQ13620.1 LLM class flavin-dependent oxidoreductase [Streptomyces huasconensis]WCL83217.1 LLM class flavin-dependent oxidoreductase [Streptomyces sp. JCM 35825]